MPGPCTWMVWMESRTEVQRNMAGGGRVHSVREDVPLRRLVVCLFVVRNVPRFGLGSCEPRITLGLGDHVVRSVVLGGHSLPLSGAACSRHACCDSASAWHPLSVRHLRVEVGVFVGGVVKKKCKH